MVWCLLTFALLLGVFGGDISEDKSDLPAAVHEYDSYEVVQPIIVGGKHTLRAASVTIQLYIHSKPITLQLRKNRHLLRHDFFVKHVREKGKSIINRPSSRKSEHCFYHGIVQGEPESVVAVSTCHGLRGWLKFSLGSLHIEPSAQAWSGPHYVFDDRDVRNSNRKCGVHSDSAEEVHKLIKRSLHLPLNSNVQTRVVEMYVVNDYTQFVDFGSSKEKVLQRTKEIINVASALYRAVNTHIALIGVEIWDREDQIEVLHDADKTMNNFLDYRRTHITTNHRNDNAQLITGKNFSEGVIGKAPIRTICSWQYSGGVNVDHSSLVGRVATTVAHELGHNFGLAHDTDLCSCREEKCIMNSNSGGSQPWSWSSCSLDNFEDAFHQGLDYCLHNLPQSLYDGPVCGNGFLEEGEQCDCGIPEMCRSKCCNSTSCRLFPNATCGTGACCNPDTCKLRERAYPCRPAVGSCDLGEHCHGNSEFCPTDAYKQDGLPCEESYCYKGKCRSRQSQCRKLWGPTGHDGSSLCYSQFNGHGLASGHCGFTWMNKSFVACAPSDVLCGMLHCTHTTEKLAFWIESLQYTHHDGFVAGNNCYGIILDVGLDMEDPGMVPSGAKCGEDKLCLNHKCRPVSELNVIPCPDCGGNGVCDNQGLCYCDEDLAPPGCTDPGEGGSIHSGPRSIKKLSSAYVVGLVIFCLIILPLLIATLLLAHRYRAELKVCVMRGCRPRRYRSDAHATSDMHASNKTPVHSCTIWEKLFSSHLRASPAVHTSGEGGAPY